jgi:membrane fusion protein (multidrug efflux system)
MPLPFSRTLRSLSEDRARWAAASLLLCLLVAAAWCWWFVAASVDLYETSDHARLEVAAATHPLTAAVAGKVVAVHLELGKVVAAGEVLLELDSRAQELELAERKAHAAAASDELKALQAELAAAVSARDYGLKAGAQALEQAEARITNAEASAAFARSEAEQLRKLGERGAASQLEQKRARTEKERLNASAAVERFELAHRRWSEKALASDRQVQIEQLRREIALLEGDLGTTRVTLDRLAYEIERRRLRAPIAGRIGQFEPMAVGTYLVEGQKIAGVIPNGAIRVVADFSPAILGRVRPGNPARVRLDGYPWTEYGTLSGSVARVASEARDGTVRVELSLDRDDGDLSLPREHGLTGTAEVLVERITPVRLVLRAAGASFSQNRGVSRTEPSR